MRCTWTINTTKIMKRWRKIEEDRTLKKGRYQRTRDCDNSTGNSGSVKSLTLSSKMQSALCTDCEISQAQIKKILDSTTIENRGTGWGTS